MSDQIQNRSGITWNGIAQVSTLLLAGIASLGFCLCGVMISLTPFMVLAGSFGDPATGRLIIEGFSMEPNFHDGQYLFVNKIEYLLGTPQRGDVVVFLPPNSTSRDSIKRVIGLPGERVEIVDGVVLINGARLVEPYPLNVGTYSYGPTVVGEDEYFVLGDNRNNSSDSHSWGTLASKKIIGKAWISYWPPPLMGFVPTYTYAVGK